MFYIIKKDGQELARHNSLEVKDKSGKVTDGARFIRDGAPGSVIVESTTGKEVK